ncbi:hypothetical protein H5410_005053, partial [Solanum commersonii]
MGTLKECEEHTIQHSHGQMHRLWKYRSHVSERHDASLELIHKVLKGGHDSTKYAFALILIWLDSEYSQQGAKTIGEMKVTKEQRDITRQYR